MTKPSERIKQIYDQLVAKGGEHLGNTTVAICQYLDEQYEAEQAKIDRIFQVGKTAQPPYDLTDKDI